MEIRPSSGRRKVKEAIYLLFNPAALAPYLLDGVRLFLTAG